MKKSKEIAFLGNVFKDIQAIPVDVNDSLKTLMNKFYELMRKHGIKQGTWTKDGHRLVSNPEWCMCFDTFKNHKILTYDVWLILNEPPKDLLAYGEKPKLKKLVKV